ncbi:MAG: type II toxin-antitoxin system RatA family toxin [Burkholderiaceae bacterium]
MKHVKKSVLLWYSASEMQRLVTAIPDYPTFLPWCERAEVLAEDAEGMTARLHLNYLGVRHAFTTRNRHEGQDGADLTVTVSLVDGPFSQLDGVWRFTPLAAPGAPGQPSTACRIDFDLRYAFSGRALEVIVSPVFDRIADTLVDAFVKRAEQVYGPR